MVSSEEADEVLVERVGKGDRLAASTLIMRHSDKVMAICYRMLGERSVAEDAVQETFLKLWKNASKWSPQGALFRTWLYRIAMNTCLDRLRKGGREAPEEAAPEQVDPAIPADQALMSDERAGTVKAAVDQLPERQRQAIILCHFEEVSNIEAAEVMEVSVEAVESLLARGRRALRKALDPLRPDLLAGE